MKIEKILKKVTAAVMLTGVIMLGITGCGSEGSGTSENRDKTSSGNEVKTEDNGELKTFRIGAGGTDGNESMELGNLAYDSGILEEELNKVGYTAEVIAFGTGGPEINAALASGDIDAAILGDFPTFTSKSNGIDTTVVALTNSANQYGIVVSDDIKEPKDLEGKKVIVPTGTVAQYYWEKFIEANSLDESKIEIINAASDAVSLLQTGDADGYAITKYIAAYYEETGIGKILESDAQVNGSTTFVFEVKSDILKENEELGVAINKALIRTYERAVANPDEMFAALKSDNISETAWRTSYSFDETLSFLSPEITDDVLKYYNDLNEWLYSHSIITEKVDVDSLFDTSYYAKAKEELNK